MISIETNFVVFLDKRNGKENFGKFIFLSVNLTNFAIF
jgi:hypothetical protein